MCIAIYKPKDKDITRKVLQTCFNANKDGCGFAYINTDKNGRRKFMIQKTMKFKDFYKKFRKAEQNNADSPFLIHFRIATHGTVDTFNCHPFKIDKHKVFIHNGILHNAPKDPAHKKSDTQMFNESILQTLPEGWMDSQGAKFLIEDYLGRGSKIAVLDIDENIKIYNESLGTWDEGIWYSNTGYKPYERFASSGDCFFCKKTTVNKEKVLSITKNYATFDFVCYSCALEEERIVCMDKKSCYLGCKTCDRTLWIGNARAYKCGSCTHQIREQMMKDQKEMLKKKGIKDKDHEDIIDVEEEENGIESAYESGVQLKCDWCTQWFPKEKIVNTDDGSALCGDCYDMIEDDLELMLHGNSRGFAN